MSRKLSDHVLVPHVLHIPIERYLRHAITAYRDEQDVLQQSASAGTPIKRAAPQHGGVAPNVSSVSGAGSNASFFQVRNDICLCGMRMCCVDATNLTRVTAFSRLGGNTYSIHDQASHGPVLGAPCGYPTG